MLNAGCLLVSISFSSFAKVKDLSRRSAIAAWNAKRKRGWEAKREVFVPVLMGVGVGWR